MRVLNIHERQLPASADQVGRLIDQLSSRDDLLWPGDRWPAMRLDRPLATRAAGGHGPVRYIVEAYEPGRLVRFRFTGPPGFVGHHRFELEVLTADRTLLRHVIEMRTRGTALITWPLIFRPLHDALLEDALDRAEAHLEAQAAGGPTGDKGARTTWSLWVRALRLVLARLPSRGR